MSVLETTGQGCNVVTKNKYLREQYDQLVVKLVTGRLQMVSVNHCTQVSNLVRIRSFTILYVFSLIHALTKTVTTEIFGY